MTGGSLRRAFLTMVLAILTLGPSLAPAAALFTVDPLAPVVPLAPAPALAPSVGDAVPGTFRHPLEEAYRTSRLRADVTAVLEARAADLGVPVVEIAWTHDVSGPRPLGEALTALAATSAPGLPQAELDRALADADALPRDLQETLARLVWRVLDAGELQAKAFEPLTPAERAALFGATDGPELVSAVKKVDVAAVLGAGRAVDQAVKEAEPVLRKWSLLLEARDALAGRAATPQGLAASAAALAHADEDLALGWALGLADRPRADAPVLPDLTLPQAVLAFYRANGIPVDDGAALGLVLLGTADPRVADPLADAVVKSTLAEGLVVAGHGPAGVDPQRLVALDREAARIAAQPGATAADLALLTEYVDLLEASADSPSITAAELLLGAARDLERATPAARGLDGRPAIFLPADTTYQPLPGGGYIRFHDETNGTSASLDLDGDGRHEAPLWTPASGILRADTNATRCSVRFYTERHNDARVHDDEVVLDSHALCDQGNDVVLQDPFGYFVVGGDRRTTYGPSLGGIAQRDHNSATFYSRGTVNGAESTYNNSLGGAFLDQLLGLDCTKQGDGGGSIVLGGFGSFGGTACDPRDNVAHDAFAKARLANVTVNSQHYQVLTWDLGGDDTYLNNAGGTYNWTDPYTLKRIRAGDFAGVVALALDAGGNDTYRGSRNYTVASALQGVGLLLDLAGNDRYSAPNDALAASSSIRFEPDYDDDPGGSDHRWTGAFLPFFNCLLNCDALWYGDPGFSEDVGNTQATYDEGDPREESAGAPVQVSMWKTAPAFAALVDREGDDTYVGRERSLAFANMSFAYLVDLAGDDVYRSGEHSQGVANNTLVLVCCNLFGPPILQTPSVAGLVDVAGNDTYEPRGRENVTQGRGNGGGRMSRTDVGDPGGPPYLCPLGPIVCVVNPLTVGLLADLGGSDTGIRQNGNVTVAGLADVGFRTRHVYRGASDPNDYPRDRPQSGISLAVEVDAGTPEAADLRPDGTVFAAPASHVDMDEDPFFALDLYVDVPRLFVLGAESATRYESDAVIAVDLGGRDTYLAPMGAATFDWNSVTSHDGRYRGQKQDAPAPEGSLDVTGFSGEPQEQAGVQCQDPATLERYPCVPGSYETGRVAPVALAVDLDGADVYRRVLGEAEPVRAFGYGHGGVGALYDLGLRDTDDAYDTGRFALGAGESFGTGILVDAEGDDRYRMIEGQRRHFANQSYGLGFAHGGGVGVAVDASRLGASGDDSYDTWNHTHGALVLDFSREYAAFVDEVGADTYRTGERTAAHVDMRSVENRTGNGEFDGFGSNNFFVRGRSANELYCHYFVQAYGDAEARFVDDGLEDDLYDPATTPWATRANDAEWKVAPSTALSADPEALPERCHAFDPATGNALPTAGNDGTQQGSGNNQQFAAKAVRGPGRALGVDNLDAYADRHARDALLDPSGEAARAADLNAEDDSAGETSDDLLSGEVGRLAHLPLDEVLAARQILLAPAARFVDGDRTSAALPTTGRDEWSVGVTAVRGPNSVFLNAQAFAQFLVRDTLPRATCSFVPDPLDAVRATGKPSGTPPEEGGRPAVPGAASLFPGTRVLETDRRHSSDPGYCAEARHERGWAEAGADDPCTFGDRDAPAREGSAPNRGDATNLCKTYFDPNPVLDDVDEGADALQVPLAAQQLPVLAEALRLVGAEEPDLAPGVHDAEDALARALGRVLRGDVAGAAGELDGGFGMQAATPDDTTGANPCDPTRADTTLDDCKDVGRVQVLALRHGTGLVGLGQWERGVGGKGMYVVGDAAGRSFFIHDWETTTATASGLPTWPDGRYDLLARTTYAEDGKVAVGPPRVQGVNPPAILTQYVDLYRQAPLSEEAVRRVHDEYGYYPGENWVNVTLDNPPSVVEPLSRLGHFRPGIDRTKTMHLVLSEPARVTVTIQRDGENPPPIPPATSAAWASCAEYQSVLHGPDVVEFELPVATLNAGAYNVNVTMTECGANAQKGYADLTLYGDATPPVADLALDRDHLFAGDLVPCSAGTPRACVELAFADETEPGSPLATRTVLVEALRPSGGVLALPAFTTTESSFVVPASVLVHGTTVRVTLLAEDEAGNVQEEATVRELPFDAFPPRVVSVDVPPTVRPDGVLVVTWKTDAADPAFPGDVEGVLLDWATGPIPAQGEKPPRVWRPVPGVMVEQALGRAEIDVAGIIGHAAPPTDADPTDTDPLTEEETREILRSWGENHTRNLTDGARFELRLRAFDVRGNVEATDPWDGRILKEADASEFDGIPPNLTAPPAIQIDHAGASMTFDLSEPGTAAVRYGPKGAAKDGLVPTVPSGNGTAQRADLPGLLQATEYEFTIEAKDLVGNARTFPENGTFAFTTDRVVTVEVTAPTAGLVASGPVRVEWSATDVRIDPYVTYRLQLSTDGGGTFPHDLTGPVARPLYERSSPLRVFVFDSRQYPDTAEAVVRVLANNSLNPGAPLAFVSPTFRIDNAPPLTVARLVGDGSNGWFRTPVTVAFEPSDTANVSRVTRVEYSRDNVTFTTLEGAAAAAARLVVEEEGRHEVFFRAADALGNVEPVRAVRFSIDRTLPQASVVLEGGAAATAKPVVDLEIAAKDALSNVQSVVVRTSGADPLVVPGDRFRSGAFVQEFKLVGVDGEKTVEVTVTDLAGNRQVVQNSIRLDTTAPVVEETVFDRVAFQTATGTVRVSEPSTLTVYVKRATDVGYQGRVEYADPATVHRVLLAGLVPSTAYQVRVVAEDALGHTAEATYDFTTLEDLTAPTPPQAVAVADGGAGVLEVSWTPAEDNVAIDHYVVLRAPVEADEPRYEPVGRAYRAAYVDDDVVPGVRYSYRVQAVDAAGNAGATSGLAAGKATTRPTLEVGEVAPPQATSAETFSYSILYRDEDGDAPVFVRVHIDGEVHDMVKERGTDAFRDGVRYVYRTTLPPTRLSTGVHTFSFEASDGSAVVQFPPEGLDAAVGPAVFASSDLAVDDAGTLGAAVRALPGAGLASVTLALALALALVRRRWA